MRTEREIPKDQRETRTPATKDRLDWISKYLELADRVMEDHPEQDRDKSAN